MNILNLFNLDNLWIFIIISALLTVFVVGLLKRSFWICLIAVVIAITIGVIPKTQMEKFKDSVVSFVDDAVEPLKKDGIVDVTGEGATKNTVNNVE